MNSAVPGRPWAPGCLSPLATTRFPRALPDIFFLVLLRDRNISAVGLQFMLKNPPESVVFHTEGVVQHRGDIVLSGKVRTKDRCQLEFCRHMVVNGMLSGTIQYEERASKQLLTARPERTGEPQVDTARVRAEGCGCWTEPGGHSPSSRCVPDSVFSFTGG